MISATKIKINFIFKQNKKKRNNYLVILLVGQSVSLSCN